MLGRPDYSWHLRFTQQHEATVAVQLAKEHLLDFYVPEKSEREAAVKRVEIAGGVKNF
jgi:hypothetical protein